MYASHPAIWAQDLVDELQKRGYSATQIVGNSGIRLGSLRGRRPTISFDKLALLFERASDLTGDDLIGFKLGQVSEFRRGGLVTFTGITSPSVETLLQNMSRYQRVMSDALMIDTGQLATKGITEWAYHVPLSVTRRQYMEFTATRIVDMLRRLTNRNLQPVKLEFRHHRKVNNAPIRKFFGCPVAFGADGNRLHLNAGDRHLPLHTADVHLHDTLLECCETALAAKKSAKTPIVVEIEREIAGGHTTQDDVAKALGMSPRTLSRRLSDEGTTFQRVMDDYREALSKSLIRNTDLQMTEIAFLTGYSNPSTFSTAFKNWTGQTPTEFRMAA